LNLIDEESATQFSTQSIVPLAKVDVSSFAMKNYKKQIKYKIISFS